MRGKETVTTVIEGRVDGKREEAENSRYFKKGYKNNGIWSRKSWQQGQSIM